MSDGYRFIPHEHFQRVNDSSSVNVKYMRDLVSDTTIEIHVVRQDQNII